MSVEVIKETLHEKIKFFTKRSKTTKEGIHVYKFYNISQFKEFKTNKEFLFPFLNECLSSAMIFAWLVQDQLD